MDSRHFEIRPTDGPRSAVRCKVCGAGRVGFEPELDSWMGFHSHSAAEIARTEPTLVDASYLHIERKETDYSTEELNRARQTLEKLGNHNVSTTAAMDAADVLRAADAADSAANHILWAMLQNTERNRSLLGDIDTPGDSNPMLGVRPIPNAKQHRAAAYRQGYLDALRDARDRFHKEGLI